MSIFREKKEDQNAVMLRQFSLQWIIHNVPFREGIMLSFEEFSSAIKRFSKLYNEHTLDKPLRDFYDTAT